MKAVIVGTCVLMVLSACGCRQEAAPRPASSSPSPAATVSRPAAKAPPAAVKAPPVGTVLLDEDFAKGMDNWWAEGAHEAQVADGRLVVDANPPPGKKGQWATVWCKTPIPAGNVKVECDARVLASARGGNNINFFLSYSDPSGRPLPETRSRRASAEYSLYHQLNGYIFTFVGDVARTGGANPDGSAKGRFRIRRCPRFRLLAETFGHHSRKDHTYRIVITKKGGHLSIAVDGKLILQARDPAPLGGGYFGLRTYRTRLWWDNIRITALGK